MPIRTRRVGAAANRPAEEDPRGMSTMALLRRLTLPTIIGILAWGFWMDDDFLRLSAGVALFMFGMLSLEQGFQAFTGGVLERVLESSTRTRIRSMGFGLVATALMQSSSLVTLITITFLSAGLIGLAAGIGLEQLLDELELSGKSEPRRLVLLVSACERYTLKRPDYPTTHQLLASK